MILLLVSLQKMIETGQFQRLKSEWFVSPRADCADSQVGSIGMENVAGAFLVLAGGVGGVNAGILLTLTS